MLKYLIFFFFFTCSVLSAQPPGCSSTNNVAGTAGAAGLYAEYFAGYFNDNPSFFPSTISTTNRIESTLNYTGNNWGAIVPPAAGTVADANTFSSRYRGSIYIATPGNYTFYLTSDDASYLWIDNNALAYPVVVANALINNGGGHGDLTVSNTIALQAGYHNIQILYGEGTGNNHLIFEYSSTSPAITRQVVPSSILCTGIQPSIVSNGPPGCNCGAGVNSQFYTGYFNDVQTYFTANTPVINRFDPQIGFSTDGGWGNVCPPLAGSNASPETYSTRFVGQVYIITAGVYTFYLTSDDAAYLWMDGNALVTNPTTATALINNGGLHSSTVVSANINLSVGLHDFKIHYGENGGNNICVLEYQNTSAGIPRQLIPQTSYCACNSVTNTLPIELLDFTAEAVSDDAVSLKWQTASEVNNKKFDIERSKDGLVFTQIDSYPSKALNGNSTSRLEYQVLDNTPERGISYYRLKQTDLDGSFKYHKIVSVDLDKKSAVGFYAYPNPSSGNFVLSITGISNKSAVETTIYTIDGKLIYSNSTEPGRLEENKSALNLNVELVPGIYIAGCVVNGVYHHLKVIVN